MASPQEITTAFIKHYYNCFDTKNWQTLAGLYSQDSMLTFEGEAFKGTESIVGKLQNLQFRQVQHSIDSHDCQPCPSGGLVVFVSGSLRIDGENLIKFAQVFTLFPVGGNNSLIVINDLFRLNYG